MSINNSLVFLVALTFVGSTSRLVGSEVTNTHASRFAKVQSIGLSEVRWTDGFWADQFATCRDRSVPAMWDLMRGTKYKPFYQHFLIAAGELEGDHHGAQWNDGDFYKWIEAACSVYAQSRDADLMAVVDQCVSAIGRAQREDGYIHTPVLIRQRNGDATARPFRDRHNFEMYNMGHLITAACVHHRVTGKEDFLDIARKSADFLAETFAHPTPELARNSVCPAHYMAMVELHRTTRDRKHLQLAERFLQMRSIVQDGGDDNQDRIEFVEQREAVGHAVRANYLYAGAADLFLETGDEEVWTPLDAIWRNVTAKKMYITGGCGALYDGASPAGSPQQSTISRVHQAYGRNYQLPNTTAHNETCAAIGNVLFNWRMFLATGDAKYIDVMELSLYNAVLSGVSLEGTDYSYVNPLRNDHPLPTELRWSRTRVPFVTSYCCPPNVLRTLAQVNGYAYAMQNDALLVNLYGSNRLTTRLMDEPLSVQQETDYPNSSVVRIAVERCPAKPFAIKLRVPGWANGASLSLNGEGLAAGPTVSGYAIVRRTWQPGDTLTIEFPMPTQLIESHPLVEETRGQVAVKRGPVVYCLESVDLPQGIRVRDVALRPDTKFTPTSGQQALDGLVTLEANLVHIKSAEWRNQLYRPLQQSSQTTISTRLIPYFAWANRSDAEMSVWLRLVGD